MDEYLWQYVLEINPSTKREDVIELRELNEWDLLIVFRNGRKVVFDRFTGYHQNVFYDDINELTPEQEQREFSYRLRSLMGRERITQEMLADMTNTTQAMISRYVRGETTPSVIVARRIAKALGYSLDEFFYKDL